MTIVVDTREQHPLPFARLGIETIRRGLDVGDYARLDDCEEVRGRECLRVRFAIERKSISDFANSWCVWSNRKAELRKCDELKARGVTMPYIIVGKLHPWIVKTGGMLGNGMYVTAGQVAAWADFLRRTGHEVVSAATPSEAAAWVAARLSAREVEG
jgi:hypothetical protein